MRSVPGSASTLIVANTYGKGEMNTRMMFVRAVAGAAMLCLAGCWSPLVVGEPLMDNDETIYGVHVQPLVGFSDHKVVGLNVAARMEPDISSDRKPNASGIVGLGVGAVFHEVWGDVCGMQIGGLGAEAKCVDGIQIAWINEARTINGIQIGFGNDGCANSRTNTSRCVQIGLVNVCGDHWFPLINFNFRDSRWCGNDEEVKCYPWGLKFRPW